MWAYALAYQHTHSVQQTSVKAPIVAPKPPQLKVKEPEVTRGTTRWATITGYNTVAAQTDSTPCIAAGGNICGRTDVVACPSDLKLFSWVLIDGKKYQCMDRTHSRFDGRFDISCDKDMSCPRKLTGRKQVTILE